MPIEVALKVLETFKNLDAEMPLQQARCLLLIAKAKDGCSLTELANKAGIGLATASRYVAALGKINRKKEQGLQLIEAFEDPMERRKKIIRLTPKGKAALKRLLEN